MLRNFSPFQSISDCFPTFHSFALARSLSKWCNQNNLTFRPWVCVWVIQNAQAHDRVCACVFAQTLIVVSIFTLFLASFLYKHYITSKNGLLTNCQQAVQCGLKWLRSGIIKWTPFEIRKAKICNTILVRFEYGKRKLLWFSLFHFLIKMISNVLRLNMISIWENSKQFHWNHSDLFHLPCHSRYTELLIAIVKIQKSYEIYLKVNRWVFVVVGEFLCRSSTAEFEACGSLAGWRVRWLQWPNHLFMTHWRLTTKLPKKSFFIFSAAASEARARAFLYHTRHSLNCYVAIDFVWLQTNYIFSETEYELAFTSLRENYEYFRIGMFPTKIIIYLP